MRNKVLFISRQSNDIPLDFALIANELNNRKSGLEIVMLTSNLKTSNGNPLRHLIFILKQMYHLATTTVVILDGYSIPVSILHHKKRLKTIQLWHASTAVKKFGWDTVDTNSGSPKEIARLLHMHDNYDYIFAASESTAQFYSHAFHASMKQMVIIGAPHLQILNQPIPGLKKKIIDSFPSLDNGKISILYVPTFRSGKPLELFPLNKVIDYKSYNLILRKHPLDEWSVIPDEMVLANKFDTLEWMQFADVIITDYSSLVIEAAILNKPLYFYVYDYKDYIHDPGLYIDYFKESIGKYAFDDPNNLLSLLQEPYDYGKLEQFRNKYVQVQPESALTATVDFIERLL